MNGEIDEQQKRLRLELEEAQQGLRSESQDCMSRLDLAHHEAAVRVAAAGGCCDPSRPEAAQVLGTPPVSREQVLDREQLADPGSRFMPNFPPG